MTGRTLHDLGLHSLWYRNFAFQVHLTTCKPCLRGNIKDMLPPYLSAGKHTGYNI